jgi:hypothetical protein
MVVREMPVIREISELLWPSAMSEITRAYSSGDLMAPNVSNTCSGVNHLVRLDGS